METLNSMNLNKIGSIIIIIIIIIIITITITIIHKLQFQ